MPKTGVQPAFNLILSLLKDEATQKFAFVDAASGLVLLCLTHHPQLLLLYYHYILNWIFNSGFRTIITRPR